MRRLILTAVLATTAGVLIGCGPSKSEPTGSAGTGTNKPSANPKPPPVPAKR
jgi:hypothetical protein